MLDTAKGAGAASLVVAVRAPDGTVTNAVTDETGRAVLAEALREGKYRLGFYAGDYQGSESFYGVIPVWFHVRDTSAHHHIPLILSPFGYSTYRGG